DDKQDVIIIQNSPTLVTTPLHDIPNHEEAAQSILFPSLDLNDDDMEELSSLHTQEQEGNDAAQRLRLAFPTHVVTNEASSILAEKSSSVSPASTPTASAGNTLPVSPRPSAVTTKKVNEAHHHSLIIGDLHTPVQKRKKAKAHVPTQNAFVSYIQDQRRNNHTDF
nr:hypothetical protein [Tanacetum cinerariifolium]